MKVIPIHPLPSVVPHDLIEEAGNLFKVRLNDVSSVFDGLELIYAFIDKLNSRFVSTFVTCSKGCSHCCNMDVQMTTLEAEYIVRATGIAHNIDTPLTTGHKTPCPFLSKMRVCTIYTYRPLVCRTYHVVSDPNLCSTSGVEVLQYGGTHGHMGNPAYRAAMEWVHFQNQHGDVHSTVKDIRNFFPYRPLSTI